jgi:thymidylate synthase ThyX
MKIVSQSVTLEFITPNAAQLIERAGRTCYKSEGQITENTAEKFVKMIIARGHDSVLEHAYAIFRIVCDRGCCYSADTDVLTNEGWKAWPDVRGDEKFTTLTKEERIEYQDATALIVREFDGLLYGLSTSAVNLRVTPEHNMYVQKHDTQAAKRGEEPWQLIQAQDIVGKRVSYKRDAEQRLSLRTSFKIPDFSTTQGNRWGTEQAHTRKGGEFTTRQFARFLGYWLSEGSLEHTEGSSYQVHLFQNIGPVLNDMVALLNEMGYQSNVSANGDSEINKVVTVCDAALYTYLVPFHGALNKRIPREVLDTFSGADLLDLLLCHVSGDGSVHHRTHHMQAYTISRGLADDLQEAALYAGISATTWIDDRVGKSGGLPGLVHRHPCYVISYVTGKNTPLVNHGDKTFRGEPHEGWVPYTGKVYCVTVPNHTLYVRRKGRPCWSGNSHEIVRHRIASYSQESTRYCNYSKEKFGAEISVVQPPGLSNDAYGEWKASCERAEAAYSRMVSDNMAVPPQIARSVLPTCLKTEIVMSANFREWRHFLKLRTSKAAHPQMQEVAGMIRRILVEQCPEVFDDGEEHLPVR